MTNEHENCKIYGASKFTNIKTDQNISVTWEYLLEHWPFETVNTLSGFG